MLTRGLTNRLFSPRGLVTIGLMATLMGLWGFRNDWDFVTRMTLVSAEVTAIREMVDRDIPSLVVTLRYGVDTDMLENEAAPTTRNFKPGDRLTAGYDAANPGDVRTLSPLDNWLIPLWVVLFGLGGMIAGLVRFIQTRRWLTAR